MRSVFLELMAMAGLMFLLFTVCGYAQDKPVDVPNSLPAALSDKLNIQKYQLLRKLEGLTAKIATHNQKCTSVRKGSAQDMECLQNLTVLQKEVGAYSNEVRDFNKAVMQAISSSPPQPVREERLRDAPASEIASEKSQREVKAEAAFVLATLAVRNADYDQALRYLQDARKAKPNSKKIQDAYNYVLSLKNSQMQMKPSLKAEYLLEALDYGKGDWEASIRYLDNRELFMDYRAAEEARRNLKEVYAEFLARQAVDRIHRKDYEGAIESLKRANDLDPDADGVRSLLSAMEETHELFSRDPKAKGK
jgi:tetratricopeptide (TPR) repeat protein